MAKRQWRSLFSTTELYGHTQSSTFPPERHDGPRPLVRITNGLGKSCQQKQTNQDYFILALKLDNCIDVSLCLWQKLELPVMDNKS